jgi:hypothetical protein
VVLIRQAAPVDLKIDRYDYKRYEAFSKDRPLRYYDYFAEA